MTTIDASTAVAAGTGSFLILIALYLWTALALAAVFRKSGEEAWQGWVPVLNLVVLLRLGGLSGWLLLLLVIPVLGQLLVWALLIIACYRINLAFGHGAGMTVLAAILLPVWATVLGFGASRWLGADGGRAQRRIGENAYPADALSDRLVPRAPSPASAAVFGPPPTAPSVAWQAGSGPAATPRAAMPPMPPPPPLPVQQRAAEPVAAQPSFAPPSFAQPSFAQPSFVQPLPAPTVPVDSVRDGFERGGFDLGAVGELTSEVTDAVPGAPAPISAVSSSAASSSAAVLSAAPRPVPGAPQPVSAARSAPVTRVPVGPAPAVSEPWAPVSSSSSSSYREPGAISELSGEVSAIAGAPDAGTPRSARASVSAQHALPEVPEEQLDETIITRRRRTIWQIVPPSGPAVPLTADVVFIGRKPSANAAYPAAQLISVDDGTVSKTHARLELRTEHWYITELDSTNGVLFATLMGTEVEAAPGVEVEAGERFFLGDAEVRIQRSDG